MADRVGQQQRRERRRDGEGREQAAGQRVGVGPRHRAEDVALDARQREQRQEARDDDGGREEDRLRDLGRGVEDRRQLAVETVGALARTVCAVASARWRKMFSTMITVASTMMPKSIAPIDSRFADSPLSTRMTTANSSAKGMVAATISALRRSPRNSHWIRKISGDAQHHVVQHGVGGDVDQRAAVVDALDAHAGRQHARCC